MAKLFVTSDFHLFHQMIITHCSRPFRNEYEMNDVIIENYNSMVSADDTVIHLGDLSAGLANRVHIFKNELRKLNGRKILLRGNHDYQPDKFYISAGFESVGTYLKIKNIFLNHYALEVNEHTKPAEIGMFEIFKDSKCDTIIHGHTHNRIVTSLIDGTQVKRINACVDVHGFKPLELNLSEL